MSDPTSPSAHRWFARIFQSAEAKHIPLRTIVATIAAVAVTYLGGKVLYRIRDVVLLIVAGSFVALILNPLVVALERWRIRRRGIAVAIVAIWSVFLVVGLAVAFGYPLANGITHFADTLPSLVNKAEHGRGWVGHLVLRYHIENWVKHNSPRLVSFAEGLGKPAFALGRGAASLLVALITTFAFVVLLLLEAPKIRLSILRSLPAERAARYTKIGAEVSRSVSGFVLGDLLTSVVAGVVVFTTLMILGVPFAALWALWVTLVDFLPTIGGALAGIPTVLFALSHSLSAGIITAVVFLVYTQLENHVLNPIVMSRTVRVSPLLVMVSVFVGADLGAWVGGLFGGFVVALLAIPIAGALQVITREIRSAAASSDTSRPLDGSPTPSQPGVDLLNAPSAEVTTSFLGSIEARDPYRE
jgi:predicted PurR-regulated permease PerM